MTPEDFNARIATQWYWETIPTLSGPLTTRAGYPRVLRFIKRAHPQLLYKLIQIEAEHA